MKVMATTCSSSKRSGSANAYLASEVVRGTLRYTCECIGVSQYGVFKPVVSNDGKKYIECIIYVWECPS